MEGIYKLKNGKKIAVCLLREILEGEPTRKTTTYRKVLEGNYFSSREHNLEVKQDVENSKLYFEFDGEKVYFENFEFTPAIDLIDKLNNTEDELYISEDEILATLMKESENLEVIYPSNYEGAPITGVLTEKRYKKHEWPYKISVEPKEKSALEVFPRKDFYISDFCSLLRDGTIRLVDKREYISVAFIEYPQKKQDGIFRGLFRRR